MLLEDLRKVAGIVAREIYKSLGRGTWKELSIGEGGDLTTEMDLMAEELVIHGLEELGHSFVLVSEESGERVFGRNPEFTVFLDPIDGTSNAIRGIPISSTSISVSRRGRRLKDVEIGVIRDIFSKEEFYSVKGKGAYFNESRVLVEERGIEIASVYPYGIDEEDLSTIRRIKKVRLLGSISLETCYVALGRLDAVLIPKEKMRTIDLSASYLFSVESGSFVSNFHLEEIGNLEISPKIRTSLIVSSSETSARRILSNG